LRIVHVVIMGCGRVGSALAHTLDEAGHSVAVIDQETSSFRKLHSTFSGTTITGIGFDRDRLREAGIERAHAFAAVSSGDNSNIIAARVARETFGVENVVARIYDPRRAEIYERLGISTVATVKWTAERILRRILPGLPAVEWTDPSFAVVLVERALPDAFVGRPVLEVGTTAARVVALRRLGSASVPDADVLVQQGDIAYFACAQHGVAALDAHLAGVAS